MPRKRIVLLLWGCGVFFLLGIWGHSIFRYSFGIWSHATRSQRATIGIIGGSFEVTWSKVLGGGRASLRWYSRSLKDYPVYRHNHPRFAGRFYHRHDTAGSPPNDLHTTKVECPLWFFLLPWTALALPFYLRFARKQKALSPDLSAPTPP